MNNPLPLSALPPIEGARLPVVYERATQALAECARIDECREWANKAEALASYARQSKDDRLRKMADRIQARAIRRCGELLRMVEPGKTGPKPELHDGAVMQLTRTQVAKDAGLSERQKVTALRVAAIPVEAFEAAVEQEEPPTVTKLAEIGKQNRPIQSVYQPPQQPPQPQIQPLHDLGGIDRHLYARASELQGALMKLLLFCQKHDPRAIAGAFKPHEIPEMKTAIAEVEAWIDQFVVNL